MKKLIAILAMALLSLGVVFGAGSGAIWTTLDACGNEQQDVNHYAAGDHVWINGDGFGEGNYDWDITGNPGGSSGDPNMIVSSGTGFYVDASGEFCFDAYTVAADDWGEYKVTFGDAKQDNYRVPEPADEETPYCGDGQVNTEFEQCDDGNNVDGDGCSAVCTIEDVPPPNDVPEFGVLGVLGLTSLIGGFVLFRRK